MANGRFTDVQARPTEFLDFTSVTLDEFQRLVPPFEATFQTRRCFRAVDLLSLGGRFPEACFACLKKLLSLV
jgi:hypothetical protein